MSIGQKFEKVADAVYEKGKTDIISNSKYIPKQASGKVISLTDVSEIAHKVKVYGDNQEVEVYGKNLFDGLFEVGSIDSDTGTDLTITIYVRSINYIPVKPSTKYTISREDVTRVIFLRFYDADKNYVGGKGTTLSPVTITTPDNCAFLRIVLAGTNVDEKAQVEIGTETPYEPYTKQTITATPEGTEADSNCPIMNIIADNDVTVDYYASYGKHEAELAMWRARTCNGTRKRYTYGFSYEDLTGYTIPEGLITDIDSIGYLFMGYMGTEIPKGLDLSGLVPVTSANSYSGFNLFNGANKLKKIYDLKIPDTNNSYEAAYGFCSSLEEIEVHRSNENTVYSNSTFINCTSLVKIIFHGIVAKNCDIHWSTKLSRESILSLLKVLKASVTGVTITLPAKCIDKQTDTLAFIQGDTELNTAYTQALANGYTIAFQ